MRKREEERNIVRQQCITKYEGPFPSLCTAQLSGKAGKEASKNSIRGERERKLKENGIPQNDNVLFSTMTEDKGCEERKRRGRNK